MFLEIAVFCIDTLTVYLGISTLGGLVYFFVCEQELI